MRLMKKLVEICSHRTSRKITSFERIHIRLCGMRMMVEYEILSGGSATLTRYRIDSSGEKVPEKSASCDNARILELLDHCKVLRWNGFHGRHPRNVCDGIMFDFNAVVDEGETIHADGSQNFPKGYHEFIRTLDELLTTATSP